MVSIPAPLEPFLTPERAEELAEAGLYADDLDGLRTANGNVRALWESTIERALRLDPAQLDERVGGEWSFVETLRHLVFVVDVWVGRTIEGLEDANHPWGMPPDHVPREAVAALGIAVDARPSVEEVLAVLAERGQQLGRVLGELAPDDLSRRCVVPQGEVELVGALQVALYEGLCHHQFANRDLAVLEADGSA